MRVSEFQIFTQFLNNLQRLRLQNLETQAQISSGKRVIRPSDDPISFDRILATKSALSVSEQRVRNIQMGTTRLDAADSTLGSASDVLLRVKDLAIQMQSGTQSASERATAAEEVKQLVQQLVQLGNTRVAGQAIFTGTSTHGRSTGLSIRTPQTLTNGVNDTLVVAVDGVTSGTLDLTSGTESLSGAQLAVRLQRRINTDATLSAAGKSVTVTFDTDRLVIASNGFGPTSTVQVASGTALATLGLDGGSTTDGSDPFTLTARTSAAVGNTGGGIIGQGQVRDANQVTLDDYVLQFTSASSFSVHNISRPVTVTTGTNNAGGATITDEGVSDPAQVRLDSYELRLQSLFTVTASNNALRFDPGSGPPVTVTVPPGRYTGDQLATAVKTGMDAGSGGDTYTVSFDGATGAFSIQNDTGNAGQLDLLFNDSATTSEALLGFQPNLEIVAVGNSAIGGDAMLTSGATVNHYVHNTTVNSAMFTLTSSNNTLYLNGSPVTLTAGSYTGAELAAEIQARLGAGFTAAYSTAAGPPGRLFTITNSTGGAVTFNHSNAASTASDVLGFDAVDSVVADTGTDVSDFDAGLTQYLSGNDVDFGGLRVVLTDSTGAPRHDDVFSFGVASEVVLANQTYTSQTAIDIEGLRFSIRDGAGAPAANDLFRILVQSEYQGDSGIQAVEVQDNQTVQTNLPGNQVFSGASIDLITAVKSFANALTGDYDGGIGQAIADVDAAFDQVLAARGSVGALMNRLETSTDVLEATQILLAETLSAEQDADLIVLVSELALQEVAIQAAVAAGSRIFNTSLLNFLR